MPPKKCKPTVATTDSEDEDYESPKDFTRRKRKAPSTQNTPKTPKTPSRTPGHQKVIKTSGFTTDCTADDLIFADATFKSYEDFEEKFNEWKAKYLHPFRVASSEALRTQDGSISEQFRYRYVVFHCARYGQPRIRGEGKRPNQNYLPCACTAMMRLNFSFAEQCLKLTSLETRHSNHDVDQELYEKMMAKENAKKVVTPKTPKTPKQKKTVTVNKTPRGGKMPSEERTEDEAHAHFERNCDEFVEDYDMPLNARGSEEPVEQPVTPMVNSIKQEIAQIQGHQPTPQTPHPIQEQKPLFHNLHSMPAPAPAPQPDYLQYQPPFPQQYLPPPPAIPDFSNQLLHDYNRLQNQMMMTQIQMQAAWAHPAPLPNGIHMPMPAPAPANTHQQPSPSCSITSSTVDENEAPVFTSLDNIARPVPLKMSENSAFSKLIGVPQGIPQVQQAFLGVPGTLNTAQQLLSSNVPPELVASRLQQLNSLISSWSQ